LSEKNAGAGTTVAAADAASAAQPELTTELPEANATPTAPKTETKRVGGSPQPSKPATAVKTSTFPQMSPPKEWKGLIVNTAFATPKNVAPYYEITAEVLGGKRLVFVAPDEALYKMAASCEGSDTKFVLTEYESKKHDGKACVVLTGIEAAS
jgi:hypothetical protein